MTQAMQQRRTRFNYRRASVTFILAYILVTILGIALSVSIAVVGHTPQTSEPLENPAYLLSERFLPLLNLVVWMAFAWMYFRKRANLADNAGFSTRVAFRLGGFWLLAAVVVDYVGFVLIKNPISLSPHDFYIGQFPWIYLIYVAILFAPPCYVLMRKREN